MKNKVKKMLCELLGSKDGVVIGYLWETEGIRKGEKSFVFDWRTQIVDEMSHITKIEFKELIETLADWGWPNEYLKMVFLPNWFKMRDEDPDYCLVAAGIHEYSNPDLFEIVKEGVDSYDFLKRYKGGEKKVKKDS